MKLICFGFAAFFILFILFVGKSYSSPDIIIEKYNRNTGDVIVLEQTYTPEKRQEIQERKMKRMEANKNKQAAERKEKAIKDIQEKKAKEVQAVTQKAQNRPIELENRRLQEELNKCHNMPDMGGSLSRASAQARESCINRVNQEINLLNSDPEYYFHSKPDRELKKISSRPVVVSPPIIINR